MTVILIAMACGCGKDNAGEEKITLNWMIMTPEQTDSQMVWSEFNKKLGEKLPGVSVNFIPCAYAEYKQRFDLALAGSQQIDLAFGGWVVNLTNEAAASSIMPLDELLKKHGKKLYDSMEDWMWELTTVSGSIYAVPNNNAMAKGRYAMITPKKYADKYLDTDKLRDIFYAQDTFNENCYDAIEEYLEKLKENGELQKGIDTTYMPGCDLKGYDLVGDRLYVKKDDDSYKVEYKWMIPESKLMFEKCREFFEKGYVREDMLSLEQPRADEGKEDGYTVWFMQYSLDQSEALSEQYGFDVVSIPIGEKYFLDASATAQTSTVVPYTAKYPEKAVELMQLLFTEEGKDLYNLLTFGIEGTHYEKLDENTIRAFDYATSPTADSKYGLPKYMCGSIFNAYRLKGEPEGYNDYVKNEINDGSDKSPLLGFRCDLDKIKVESSQLQAIASEYILPLTTGAISDSKQQYEAFMSKLKSAGVEKVKAEVQKQIDEFAAKK